MRQDVLLLLFGEMMLFISYSQSWPIAIKIEPVDTQDCCELGYELVMLHRWHTLSLSTERMNFERPNLQRHLHLSVFHLIRGPSLVLASSGQDRKLAGAQKQKAYEINYLYHVSFWWMIIFILSLGLNEASSLWCRSVLWADNCQ